MAPNNCGEPRVHQKENRREGADLIGYVDKTCDVAHCVVRLRCSMWKYGCSSGKHI